MGPVELTVTVHSPDLVRAVRENQLGEWSGKVLRDPLRDKTVAVFADLLRDGKITKRAELEVLGAILYGALFEGEKGEIAEALAKALEAVPAGERLCLRLSLQQGARGMNHWPWEYLSYPGSEAKPAFFFATHTKLVLSRYQPLSNAGPAPTPAPPPLVLLFVVSQLNDPTGRVKAQEVIDAIHRLKEIQSLPIEIKIMDRPTTMENFLTALRAVQPHVLHFIGLGHVTGDHTQIFFQDDAGEASAIPDRVFAEAFSEAQVFPRLIVLHLWDSGRPDAAAGLVANFAGLAPHLMVPPTQAVVAMQYPIPNADAITFARHLYTELARGERIDRAVGHARWRLATTEAAYNNRIFGTPVFHLHRGDAIIQKVAPGSPVK